MCLVRGLRLECAKTGMYVFAFLFQDAAGSKLSKMKCLCNHQLRLFASFPVDMHNIFLYLDKRVVYRKLQPNDFSLQDVATEAKDAEDRQGSTWFCAKQKHICRPEIQPSMYIYKQTPGPDQWHALCSRWTNLVEVFCS
jgi:hypothetical protein